MKKIFAVIMILFCFTSFVGCKKEEITKSSAKKQSSGRITAGVSANAEYIENQSTLNSESYLNGQQSTIAVNTNSSSKEIIPSWKDVFKINNMTGESDLQANKLRNNILNAEDKVNITGTSYYFSSLHGDDNNNGKSPNQAFKTIKKAGELLLKSGDAVLLERGSIFRLAGSFTLKNGITYAAYGKGNKPAVYGSSMNYAIGSIWQPHNQKNVWVLDSSIPGDVGSIVFNHGEIRSKAIEYVLSLQKNGDFYYDSTAGKLYLYYDNGNPGLKFNDIEISPRFVLFSIPTAGHDIKIDNIAFKYSGNFAIRGIQLSDISITNCEIGWIGGAWQPDGMARYGNGIEVGGIVDSSIKNNWVYQIFDSGMTFQLNENEVKNTYFTQNLFEFCGMSAFEWWQSTKPGVINGTIENVYFTNNISRFVGYGWQYGTARGARHIQGPYQSQDYPNMKNFVIKDNIFDTAMGGLSLWVWLTPDVNGKGYLMSDNTYYQGSTESGIGNVFGYGKDRSEVTVYAKDQKSLENAVAKMESHPKLVKWVG